MLLFWRRMNVGETLRLRSSMTVLLPKSLWIASTSSIREYPRRWDSGMGRNSSCRRTQQRMLGYSSMDYRNGLLRIWKTSSKTGYLLYPPNTTNPSNNYFSCWTSFQMKKAWSFSCMIWDLIENMSEQLCIPIFTPTISNKWI